MFIYWHKCIYTINTLNIVDIVLTDLLLLPLLLVSSVPDQFIYIVYFLLLQISVPLSFKCRANTFPPVLNPKLWKYTRIKMSSLSSGRSISSKDILQKKKNKIKMKMWVWGAFICIGNNIFASWFGKHASILPQGKCCRLWHRCFHQPYSSIHTERFVKQE